MLVASLLITYDASHKYFSLSHNSLLCFIDDDYKHKSYPEYEGNVSNHLFYAMLNLLFRILYKNLGHNQEIPSLNIDCSPVFHMLPCGDDRQGAHAQSRKSPLIHTGTFIPYPEWLKQIPRKVQYHYNCQRQERERSKGPIGFVQWRSSKPSEKIETAITRGLPGHATEPVKDVGDFCGYGGIVCTG